MTSNSQDDLTAAPADHSRSANGPSSTRTRQPRKWPVGTARRGEGVPPYFDQDEYMFRLAIQRSLQEQQQGPHSTGPQLEHLTEGGFVGLSDAIQESKREQERQQQQRQQQQQQQRTSTRPEADLIAEALEQSRLEAERREHAARNDDEEEEAVRKAQHMSLQEQRMYELEGFPSQ